MDLDKLKKGCEWILTVPSTCALKNMFLIELTMDQFLLSDFVMVENKMFATEIGKQHFFLMSDLAEKGNVIDISEYWRLHMYLPKHVYSHIPEKRVLIDSWQDAEKNNVMRSYFGNNDVFDITDGESLDYDYEYSGDYFLWIREKDLGERKSIYDSYLLRNGYRKKVSDQLYDNPLSFVATTVDQYSIYKEIVQAIPDQYTLFIPHDGLGALSLICITLGRKYVSYEINDIGSYAYNLGIITHNVPVDRPPDSLLMVFNCYEYYQELGDFWICVDENRPYISSKYGSDSDFYYQSDFFDIKINASVLLPERIRNLEDYNLKGLDSKACRYIDKYYTSKPSNKGNYRARVERNLKREVPFNKRKKNDLVKKKKKKKKEKTKLEEAIEDFDTYGDVLHITTKKNLITPYCYFLPERSFVSEPYGHKGDTKMLYGSSYIMDGVFAMGEDMQVDTTIRDYQYGNTIVKYTKLGQYFTAIHPNPSRVRFIILDGMKQGVYCLFSRLDQANRRWGVFDLYDTMTSVKKKTII